jgi:uncharacterized membrane protein YphA (DoxX/SURF4 family)
MKKHLTLKNLGWVLIILTSFMLLMSGTQKIIGTEEMVKNFTFTNLLPYLALVGVMEVIGVVLLLYPKTSIYGAILLSSIMSAAAVIHLSYMGGAGVLIPVFLGLLAWTGHCLRAYSK